MAVVMPVRRSTRIIVDESAHDKIRQAFETMHEALSKIVEGGPWSCVDLAETALEDVEEIMEDDHG